MEDASCRPSQERALWKAEQFAQLPERQEDEQALVKQTRKMASQRHKHCLLLKHRQTHRAVTIKLATAQKQTHL